MVLVVTASWGTDCHSVMRTLVATASAEALGATTSMERSTLVATKSVKCTFIRQQPSFPSDCLRRCSCHRYDCCLRIGKVFVDPVIYDAADFRHRERDIIIRYFPGPSR